MSREQNRPSIDRVAWGASGGGLLADEDAGVATATATAVAAGGGSKATEQPSVTSSFQEPLPSMKDTQPMGNSSTHMMVLAAT